VDLSLMESWSKPIKISILTYSVCHVVAKSSLGTGFYPRLAMVREVNLKVKRINI
jgi:hypothetical protein